MSKRLEEMLEDGLLEPPDDFALRVMQRIEIADIPRRPSPAPTRLEWAAVIGGSLAGIAQLMAFMFGIWTAVAAV
jgi:hypothetical protein